MRANYFDSAASSPVDPAVFESMRPPLEGAFGNAHSLHSWGREAREAVERARVSVSRLLGSEPEEVVFTSGATEANNWILSQYDGAHVAVSPFEHSSVREPADSRGAHTLANDGWDLHPATDTKLVSVMSVNNETGALIDLPSTKPGTLVHRDITQQLGKLPVEMSGVDFASMSAHKLYGPKGVGALFVRGGRLLEPYLRGGDQENGQRAGTLNVPGIVGFGVACELAADRLEDDLHRAAEIRATVLNALSKLTDWRETAHTSNSPYLLSVSFLGIEGESVVIDADSRGFAVSSGAACSARSTEPSHVLQALGVEPEWAKGTVRISFSRWNTPASAEALVGVLVESVTNLRKMGK